MFEIIINIIKNRNVLRQYLYCASVNGVVINK